MKHLLSCFLLCATLAAGAQSRSQKIHIAAGPVLSFPTGDLNTVSSVGIGAEMQASVPVAPNFEGFAQAGFQSFIGKSYNVLGTTGRYQSISHVPILVGARYAANGLLGGLGIGYGLYSASNTQSGFAVSPQIGYAFGRSQLIANYTSVSVSGGSLGYVGLKLYFVFN